MLGIQIITAEWFRGERTESRKARGCTPRRGDDATASSVGNSEASPATKLTHSREDPQPRCGAGCHAGISLAQVSAPQETAWHSAGAAKTQKAAERAKFAGHFRNVPDYASFPGVIQPADASPMRIASGSDALSRIKKQTAAHLPCRAQCRIAQFRRPEKVRGLTGARRAAWGHSVLSRMCGSSPSTDGRQQNLLRSGGDHLGGILDVCTSRRPPGPATRRHCSLASLSQQRPRGSCSG